MFTRSLEITLHNAFIQAKANQHEYLTLEHLLLALLDNVEVYLLFNEVGTNVERLRTHVSTYVFETTPSSTEEDQDVMPSMSFQRVIQHAISAAKSAGEDEVDGVKMLLSLYEENESQAVFYLNQENVTKPVVLQYIATRVFDKDQKTAPDELAYDHLHSAPSITEISQEEEEVSKYAVDLNMKANLDELDPMIGREPELSRMLQILCRRHKNNPILVGEPGVGKTSVVEGLAQKIARGDVPEGLENCTIYSLDIAGLLAGTKYRGDFEKRFKTVLKSLSKYDNAIIFIDEIHNIVGAGSTVGGSMDASNLLKPLLSSGEVRCIGATTYEEYRNHFCKDPALIRRFQKIDVDEPSPEETKEILTGLQPSLEAHHNVEFKEEAFDRAIELSKRYLNDRFLPDKAIDVIDEAGAALNVKNKSNRVIDAKMIDKVVAKVAQIPLEQLSTSDKKALMTLPKKLKSVVFDQDDAIDTLTDAIKLSRAGLRDANKPIGSFLMVGPTGVGKTAITCQLAKELGIELIRFDMSEYMEKHAVSRLIGTPPGYVGYEQGGLLTEALIKHPHAVVLLDEIEKAHPDIFNILLQVMDYGTLTDNNGRQADFRHAIIVMTSNAGAEVSQKASIGFSDATEQCSYAEALGQTFAPEFRNRLDAVLQFKHLELSTVEKIVDKELKEIKQLLTEKNVQFKVSPLAKQWIAKKGYDRCMGARPIARLIQEKIKQPLSEEILFGDFEKKGGIVQVKVEKGELVVSAS